MLIWIKYKYSGYGIGFDSCSGFSFTDEAMGKMSLFLELIWVHLYIVIIKKDILIVGEGPKQKLDDTTLTAEAKYPMNFTQLRKRFVLSLQYKGRVSYLLMNKNISIQSKKLLNKRLYTVFR